MIALQPSRAGLSTTTIMSIKPSSITYVSKSTNLPKSTYAGTTSKPSPNTLQGACFLAQRIRVTQIPEHLRALDALREHQKFVESLTPYKDVFLAEQLAIPPPALSSSRIVEIDGHEQIPPYMGPVSSYNKKRKSCPIMKVRLPVMNDGKVLRRVEQAFT